MLARIFLWLSMIPFTVPQEPDEKMIVASSSGDFL